MIKTRLVGWHVDRVCTFITNAYYLRKYLRLRLRWVPDTDGVVRGAGGKALPIVIELRVQHVVAVARVHFAVGFVGLGLVGLAFGDVRFVVGYSPLCCPCVADDDCR